MSEFSLRSGKPPASAQFLVFTLAAPMASFGALAVGERRPSDDRPTKSQVIGLIAAALGIERVDEQRQQALAASLGYAVRVDHSGALASDFHTAEAAKEASVRRRARTHGPIMTRADELSCDDRKTILSMREYRTGVLAVIVVWLRQPGPATLDDMHAALIEPCFVPFAGRKAFPLMLPSRPAIVPSNTVEAALEGYDAEKSAAVRSLEQTFIEPRLQRRSDPNSPRWIYADADAPLATAYERIEQRRDNPDTRAKWRFGLRTEVVVYAPGGQPNGGGR